jgi:hypothetical protein
VGDLVFITDIFMDKTITLIILVGVLIFVIGFLVYLFVIYVKENLVLFQSFNWKIFGEVLIWRLYATVRIILFFIGGLFMVGWAIIEMLQTNGTDWGKTKATLSRVTLSERTINSEPEEFLTMVYDFQVEGNKYEVYDEVARYSFMSVEKQTEEVWSLYKTKDVFYNEDNPYQTELNIEDTGIGMYISALFIGFIFMLSSYWLVMEAYKQKLADS